MHRLSILAAALAASFMASAAVSVKCEQLAPEASDWKFKTIPGPSKSDIAQKAKVTLAGNQWDPAGNDGSVLVDGRLPFDSLNLKEEAVLTNGNANGGTVEIDLGTVQPIAAVTAYSWHENPPDQGPRGPQVYVLSGSVDGKAWTKIADVDSRPNKTGDNWGGQHGVAVSDTAGKLGDFRYLSFALQATRSPRQTNPAMTNTLFSEIDVHTAATLPKAGDAVVEMPMKDEHAWVVFKTHLDIGYTETIENVLRKYREPMMNGALQVIEASHSRPAEQRFSWTLAGWPLAHVLGPRQDPTRKVRIEQAVREGAIAFHALPFTLHTETDDLEDLVRGLGISSQLARQYGRPLPISGKMTDVPCHSWVWPTLLSHAGVKFLQLGCNGSSFAVQVPALFWWEGPDGSRILCNYTAQYGSGLQKPAGWPSKNYLAMVMTGDNHGPPSAADVDNLRRQAKRSLPGVQLHFGTLDDFAKAVIAENPTLPVVRADMPDTWIHGWLSMPVEAKAAHNLRPLEPALDALDTQLHLWGLATGELAPALASAYEQSNLFSEHTFGPAGPNCYSWNNHLPRYLYGADWKAAYDRGAYQKYEAAFDDKRAFARNADVIVQRELRSRLELLAKSVNAGGKRIVVYNALPWPRSGLVTVDGRQYFAKDIPACGYKTLSDLSDASDLSGAPGKTTLETPYFKAIFDLKRGGIASLVEKQTGRELVDQTSPYALGQFLHERFDVRQMQDFHNAYSRRDFYQWPKGNLPKDATRAALTPPAWTLAVRSTAAADVATLTATDTLGLAKGISLVFTLPRQQANLEVEWRVAGKTADPIPEGGWLCFPFAVKDPLFRLGRLGGPIDPAKEIIGGANRHYFCISTGVAIAGGDKTGIGLCPIDSPCVSLGEPGLWKFSLDYVAKKPTVFVNLYNNMWNTNFPEWIDGTWSSRVRLWPTAELAVPSWEARLPLLAASADGPAGKLPVEQAGLSVSRPGTLVTSFGQNPDGQGTLLRVWEQNGASGELTVTLPAEAKFTTATPVSLRGEKTGEPVKIANGKLVFGLKAYAPASFVLE